MEEDRFDRLTGIIANERLAGKWPEEEKVQEDGRRYLDKDEQGPGLITYFDLRWNFLFFINKDQINESYAIFTEEIGRDIKGGFIVGVYRLDYPSNSYSQLGEDLRFNGADYDNSRKKAVDCVKMLRDSRNIEDALADLIESNYGG